MNKLIEDMSWDENIEHPQRKRNWVDTALLAGFLLFAVGLAIKLI